MQVFPWSSVTINHFFEVALPRVVPGVFLSFLGSFVLSKMFMILLAEVQPLRVGDSFALQLKPGLTTRGRTLSKILRVPDSSVIADYLFSCLWTVLDLAVCFVAFV